MNFFIDMISHGLLLLGIGAVIIAMLPWSIPVVVLGYLAFKRG